MTLQFDFVLFRIYNRCFQHGLGGVAGSRRELGAGLGFRVEVLDVRLENRAGANAEGLVLAALELLYL